MADILCHLPKGRINQDLVLGTAQRLRFPEDRKGQLWGRNGPLNALCRKPQHLVLGNTAEQDGGIVWLMSINSHGQEL